MTISLTNFVLIREVSFDKREQYIYSQYLWPKNWRPFQRGVLSREHPLREGPLYSDSPVFSVGVRVGDQGLQGVLVSVVGTPELGEAQEEQLVSCHVESWQSGGWGLVIYNPVVISRVCSLESAVVRYVLPQSRQTIHLGDGIKYRELIHQSWLIDCYRWS